VTFQDLQCLLLGPGDVLLLPGRRPPALVVLDEQVRGADLCFQLRLLPHALSSLSVEVVCLPARRGHLLNPFIHKQQRQTPRKKKKRKKRRRRKLKEKKLKKKINQSTGSSTTSAISNSAIVSFSSPFGIPQLKMAKEAAAAHSFQFSFLVIQVCLPFFFQLDKSSVFFLS